jgi:chaperonin GroEL (HSP60 family)
MTYIKGCKNPKSITILIHGGTMHVIDEIERALKDGLGDILSSIKTGLVVCWGRSSRDGNCKTTKGIFFIS